jgi:hypothetical protein
MEIEGKAGVERLVELFDAGDGGLLLAAMDFNQDGIGIFGIQPQGHGLYVLMQRLKIEIFDDTHDRPDRISTKYLHLPADRVFNAKGIDCRLIDDNLRAIRTLLL